MTFKHSCASTCASSLYFKNIHSMVSKSWQNMSIGFCFQVRRSPQTLLTNNVWPPRWDRSYKNSTTELVHSRYFVLRATFPRAEVWNPLAEREPLLPFGDFFLVAGDGNHSNHGFKNINHHDMPWCRGINKNQKTWEQLKKKTVKSQKLPQEIAFQTWFYIVIASLASNSWSSMIQYPPPPKKNIKNPPPNSLGLFGRDGVPQLLSSLPLPFLSRYGPRAVHSPQVRYVAPSEGPRPSLPLLPGDRHKWGPPKIRGFR